jgi:hypothetical protein
VEGLENLIQSAFGRFKVTTISYLKLNLGLSNVLLAAVAASGLLGLSNKGTDVL